MVSAEPWMDYLRCAERAIALIMAIS